MRRGAWLRCAAVLTAVICTVPVSEGALGATISEKRFKQLEQILLNQQKKLQEQEKQLQSQKEKIARQERRLKAIEKTDVARVKKASPKRIPKGSRSVLVTPKGFAEVDPLTLSLFRGGIQVPAVRVIMPDGTSFLAPADRFKYTLAQDVKPKEPTFITEPEKKKAKKKAAPTRKRRTRTVQRRRVAPRRVVVRATKKQQPTPKQEDKSVRAKAEKQADQLLLDKGAILIKPGTLQIEPGIEYSHYSTSNVAINGVSLFNAIVIGTIRVDDLQRDVLTGTLKARYGIMSRLQADVTIPFVYRSEKEVLGVGTADVFERAINGYGLGDIELGLTGQPIIAHGWVPNVLVRVGARIPTGEDVFSIPTVNIGPGGQTRLTRAPTGSGFYAAFATVTAVWSIDPVAFFVGGGYTYNIPRNISAQIGRINPGNSISYFTGMNLAVNDRVALNLSFSGQRVSSTTQNSRIVPNTSYTDARVALGASVGLTDNISLLANAGIGLTRQSPDFTFSVSVPITFNTQ